MKRIELRSLRILSRYMAFGIGALGLMLILYPVLVVFGYGELAHEVISMALPPATFVIGYAMGRYSGPAMRILERR